MIPSSITYTLPYSPLRIDSSSNLIPMTIITTATSTVIGRTSRVMLGFAVYGPIVMRFSLENMLEMNVPRMNPTMLDAAESDMIAEDSRSINLFLEAPKDLRIMISLEWVEAIRVDIR